MLLLFLQPGQAALDDHLHRLGCGPVAVDHRLQYAFVELLALDGVLPVAQAVVERAVVQPQQEHGSDGVQSIGKERLHPQVCAAPGFELHGCPPLYSPPVEGKRQGVNQGVLVVVVLVYQRLCFGQQPGDEPPPQRGDGVGGRIARDAHALILSLRERGIFRGCCGYQSLGLQGGQGLAQRRGGVG